MRHHRAISAAATVGVLLLLIGCATGGATASSGPQASLSAKALPARVCVPGAHIVCLTPASSGKTVTLTIGTTVDVSLRAASSSWSGLSQVGPRLLRPIGSTRAGAGTIEESYRAVETGHTALRAFERPVCPPMRACPQFILVWQVNIHVRPR
ncbi:MAG TPA: hypothetical protein VN892_16590 [Solirubrobacteraceae bacterium]|nr:hypothetical protein [Solirubrobacteraceae bacterium]